ncbi:MAG: hypothetical protein ACREA0_04225 [bacterium]
MTEQAGGVAKSTEGKNMRQAYSYISSEWQSIFVTVVWIPTALAAFLGGDIVLGILVLALGAVALWGIYTVIEKQRRRRCPVFGGSAAEVPRKGIILTAGGQTETIDYSIMGLKPQYVGFLCTGETLPIVKAAPCTKGFDEEHSRYEIVDPWDMDDIRLKTILVIDWMLSRGLRARDLALDPTGGFKSMSLGAYAAAQERHIDTQYVRSTYDNQNRPVRGTQTLTFLSRYSVEMASASE